MWNELLVPHVEVLPRLAVWSLNLIIRSTNNDAKLITIITVLTNNNLVLLLHLKQA